MLQPRILVWLIGCLTGALASAAEPPLPPLAGEIAGDLVPSALPGGPTLRWKIALRAGASGTERIGDLSIEGKGARASGLVRLVAPTTGVWRLDAGELELRTWFAPLAAKFVATLVGATADGHLAVRGEGRLEEGKLTGRLALDLRGGALHSSAESWSVSGLRLQGALGQLPALASDGRFTLAFDEARFAGLLARNGTVEFAVDSSDVVHVSRAACEMLDGRVEVAPFSFPLAKPAVKTDVRVQQIELAQLASLLPPVLSAASGKISGRIALAWNAESGVQPGSGRLQIDPGSTVTIRLAPQPGFFTSAVPPTISVLPGPLAKLVKVTNPAYEPLRAMEMGESRLEVSALEVGLSPDGDAQGRTARLVFTARPENREDVEFVKFEVNVKGPLADVLRLGFEHGVSVRTR